MKKKEENKKGFLQFKYITISKCPKCGSPVKYYRHYLKYDEAVTFECGYSLQSETPTIIKETGVCKNSSEWKKMVKLRLHELNMVKTFISNSLHDKKLIKELNERMSSIRYQIESWWSS